MCCILMLEGGSRWFSGWVNVLSLRNVPLHHINWWYKTEERKGENGNGRRVKITRKEPWRLDHPLYPPLISSHVNLHYFFLDKAGNTTPPPLIVSVPCSSVVREVEHYECYFRMGVGVIVIVPQYPLIKSIHRVQHPLFYTHLPIILLGRWYAGCLSRWLCD